MRLAVFSIPSDILDDLCSRFLVNLPPNEKTDMVRICFQIEQAHWFYLDFYCANDQRCKQCGIREFIRIVFHHCPFLKHEASRVDLVIEEWREYKSAVPTYGAILLDTSLEKVLLVQGYYATSSWGFPKGKVNEAEMPHICAVREVKEETGFDCSALIDPQIFLEQQISDATVRLYLIPGVLEAFPFTPRTRNEIKQIRWFLVDDLPSHRNDVSKVHLGLYANNFYTVTPFVASIKRFIQKRTAPPSDSRYSSEVGTFQSSAASILPIGSRRVSVDQLFASLSSSSAQSFSQESQQSDTNMLPTVQENTKQQQPQAVIHNTSSPVKSVDSTISSASKVELGEIRPAVSWQDFRFDLRQIFRS